MYLWTDYFHSFQHVIARLGQAARPIWATYSFYDFSGLPRDHINLCLRFDGHQSIFQRSPSFPLAYVRTISISILDGDLEHDLNTPFGWHCWNTKWPSSGRSKLPFLLLILGPIRTNVFSSCFSYFCLSLTPSILDLWTRHSVTVSFDGKSVKARYKGEGALTRYITLSSLTFPQHNFALRPRYVRDQFTSHLDFVSRLCHWTILVTQVDITVEHSHRSLQRRS
jgi:hypothetical protein